MLTFLTFYCTSKIHIYQNVLIYIIILDKTQPNNDLVNGEQTRLASKGRKAESDADLQSLLNISMLTLKLT